MRSSDWSSDVCSSDLGDARSVDPLGGQGQAIVQAIEGFFGVMRTEIRTQLDELRQGDLAQLRTQLDELRQGDLAQLRTDLDGLRQGLPGQGDRQSVW